MAAAEQLLQLTSPHIFKPCTDAGVSHIIVLTHHVQASVGRSHPRADSVELNIPRAYVH
jgi:hypothetical protein